jgi:Na+-driven multidrug efflux pump
MTTKKNNLSNWYLRKNISLAWPLALNALLMQSMLIIDILLVSPLGEVSLAAMGIATTIVAFFLGLQVALGNGTQLIIGRIFGAKDANGLIKSLTSALFINVIAAVIFIVILVVLGDNLVALLAPDPWLASHVHNYLFVAQWIFLVNGITQVIIVFLNGQGNTKTPFQAYLLELPFNAVVSYFLIFGVTSFSFDGLGITGAAYGSLASVVLRFIYLFSHIRQLPLLANFKLLNQVELPEIIKHFNEILPIATNFLVLSIGNTVYQLLFSQLNIYSYVAVTLVFPWLRIATQVIVAWAQANAISITQALGEGEFSHVKPIVDSCIKLGAILSGVVALALYGFSLSVEMIYPKVEQQTLLALASIMPLYVILPLIRTYNTIAGNSLRAVGQSLQVLRVHFITQWFVVLPLCALFILYFELPLFWAFALLPLEEALKAIPFYLMLNKSCK